MGMNDIDTAMSDVEHYISHLRRVPGDQQILNDLTTSVESMFRKWQLFRDERKRLVSIEEYGGQ